MTQKKPSVEQPKAPLAPGEGGWYSRLTPEPIDVIEAWELGYHEATALKYLSRWRHKGGVEDLHKAIWFLQRLIDKEDGQRVL